MWRGRGKLRRILLKIVVMIGGVGERIVSLGMEIQSCILGYVSGLQIQEYNGFSNGVRDAPTIIDSL